MKCVIVSDASCLIDIQKGGLVEASCSRPYRLIVPLSNREFEDRTYSDQQWRILEENGMNTRASAQQEVEQAVALNENHVALSPNDCLCLVTALNRKGILLTGDFQLRKVAAANGIPVHGVLWAVDELAKVEGQPASTLVQALRIWQFDSAVFLPSGEIRSRIRKLSGNP